MNRRLQQFMAAENISQSQFADTIGVARASVSHILAGRNKPGFDFIESMARNYPEVNLEWVITGKGKMYKSASPKPVAKTVIPDDLFSSYDEEELSVKTDNIQIDNNLYSEKDSIKGLSSRDIEIKSTSISKPRENSATKRQQSESIALAKVGKNLNNQRNILKIIVFYDDNTYQELK